MTPTWLFVGFVLGILFICIARAVGERWLFSGGLVVVAAMYIGLAAYGGAGAKWYGIEFLGALLYGTFGILGTRWSPWCLVIGWALHPVWDVALHLLDGGAAFTPPAYAIQCISFDLVVAAYIALQILRRPDHNSLNARVL